MNIVLIGFMGSGKSRVADALAKKIGWDSVDTDNLIVKNAGAAIPEIFKTQGEPAFRRFEREAVRAASSRDKMVIATGGGVPLNPDNMADLARNGFVIWLQASPEFILKRAGDISLRPLIDPHDPLGSISKRLNERIPFYSKAEAVVDTDNLTVQDVVEKIWPLVPGLKK